MTCKECGAQLPDIAKFCYKCGKTIDVAGVQEDFDPFGTVDVEEIPKKTTENAVKEIEEVQEVIPEEVDDAEKEAVEEEAVAKEENVSEENASEENGEEEITEDAEDEEEGTQNKGFKIMINPDYVPPEVEEEKPFYEEHVNYEELREERAAKMEKKMQVFSVFVAIAVVIGLGLFIFGKFTVNKDFKEKLSAADKLYEAGDYEAAFNAYGDLVEHKGADEEEMVIKQFECLQAIGDEARARDFAFNACRKYSSNNIRKLLDAVGSGGSQTAKPSQSPQASVAPSTAPSEVPSETPSEAPSETPSEVPSETPSEAPSETPSEVPSETPSEAPSEVPSETPSQVPSETPSQVPSQAPSEVPSQVPSQAPTTPPSQSPNEEDSAIGDYTAYEDTVASLSEAMGQAKLSSSCIEAIRVMITEEYAALCAKGQDVYYVDGKFVAQPADGDSVLMVCEKGCAYFGGFAAGKKSGAGVYLKVTQSDAGISYYFYRGVWAENYPNGAGNIEKLSATTGIKTVISTTFENGYYNGEMKIAMTKGATNMGEGTCTVEQGTPVVLKDEAGNEIKSGEKSVIGYLVGEDGSKTEILWDGASKYCVEGLTY